LSKIVEMNYSNRLGILLRHLTYNYYDQLQGLQPTKAPSPHKSALLYLKL